MILVTGAAGLSGRTAIGAMARRSLHTRAFVRDEAQALQAREAGAAETFVGDLRNPADAAAALRGCDALHLIAPRLVGDEVAIGLSWLAAARHAGLRKVVYQGVSHPWIQDMPHHWDKLLVQRAIEETGLPFVVLQPTNYMRNVTWAWELLVRERVYRLPYSADTPLSWVDSDDVGEAAAVVHATDRFDQGAYELCGTVGGLTRRQLCAMLSERLGVEIRPEVADWDDWRRLPRYARWSSEQLRRLQCMFAYYDRHGLRGGNPAVLSMLLGRPATTYEQYLDRLMALPPQQRAARD